MRGVFIYFYKRVFFVYQNFSYVNISFSTFSGAPNHYKLIIGVFAGLFVIFATILTVYLVRRNAKNRVGKQNALIQDDELDTAV